MSEDLQLQARTVMEKSRQVGADFCMVEILLANAILDWARINRTGQRRNESIARARLAYDAAGHFLTRFEPPEDLAGKLHFELDRLGRRLATVGAARG